MGGTMNKHFTGLAIGFFLLVTAGNVQSVTINLLEGGNSIASNQVGSFYEYYNIPSFSGPDFNPINSIVLSPGIDPMSDPDNFSRLIFNIGDYFLTGPNTFYGWMEIQSYNTYIQSTLNVDWEFLIDGIDGTISLGVINDGVDFAGISLFDKTENTMIVDFTSGVNSISDIQLLEKHVYLLSANLNAELENGDPFGSFWYNFGDSTSFLSVSILNPVPEPSNILLFGTGLAGLAAFGRRRRN